MLQFVVGPVEASIEIRQFLVCGHHGRCQPHGPFEREDGFVGLLGVVVDEAEKVVRVGHAVVARERAAQRLARRDGNAGTIAGKSQRIEERRVGVILESIGGLGVPLGRLRRFAARVVQPAEGDEGLWRARGEPPGRLQIADGSVVLPFFAVRLAAPVVRDHRLGPQGNGAAKRLDGRLALPADEGHLPLGEETAVEALLAQPRHQCGGSHDEGGSDAHRDEAFHDADSTPREPAGPRGV